MICGVTELGRDVGLAKSGFRPTGPGLSFAYSPFRRVAASPVRQLPSSKPNSIPFVEVPFKATVRRIEHHVQGFALAFQRIGSERLVGDIHFSAGESVVADNPGYINKMTVRSITRSYDAPGRGPFIGSRERWDSQSDQQESR
jgi:hypothetical protein